MADYGVCETIFAKYADGRNVKINVIEYNDQFKDFDISLVSDPLYAKFPVNSQDKIYFSLEESAAYPSNDNYFYIEYQNDGNHGWTFVSFINGRREIQSSIDCKWMTLVKRNNVDYYIVWYINRDKRPGGTLLESILGKEIYSWANAIPKPTKFYLSSPEFGYPMRRGESVELVFTEEYSDGTVVTPAPFKVLNKQPDKYGITNWTLSGNTLTITNECWNSYVFLATQPADSIVLTGRVDLTILDPTPPPSSSNPYLPPDGGISGGGNSSNISTVQGIFDADPGPSIVENLPVGSSGSDIASSGMYTKYLCNNALLNLLAEFFWEDNVGIQALKAVLGNPIDSIISLTAYPFALDTLVPKTSTTIYFGQYDSHFSAFSLTKSSFQIDWGSVKIPFFWGSFLDYSPYTKIQLYLPWGVGFVSIDPNEVVPWSRKNTYNKADFVDGTIRVITNIELDKGACVHNIIGNNGRIIGSFGGVVGKQVPVTGSDNSARILAMISAAVSSSAAIGTSAGGTLAAGKNLAYGKGMSMAERADGREMIGNYKSYVGNTVQSLSNALSSPPSYPRAGTFSDATNTLGYQYPYLIISRPSQSVPQQYGRFMGYPSNIFHNHLGEVRGYTEVSSIHLDNINATANELDELESILKGGVLL